MGKIFICFYVQNALIWQVFHTIFNKNIFQKKATPPIYIYNTQNLCVCVCVCVPIITFVVLDEIYRLVWVSTCDALRAKMSILLYWKKFRGFCSNMDLSDHAHILHTEVFESEEFNKKSFKLRKLTVLEIIAFKSNQFP